MVVLGHASVEGEAGGWQGDLCRAELRRVNVSTSIAGLTNSSANVWVLVGGRSRPLQKCELSVVAAIKETKSRAALRNEKPCRAVLPIRSGCRTTAAADVSTCVAAETGRQVGLDIFPLDGNQCQLPRLADFHLQPPHTRRLADFQRPSEPMSPRAHETIHGSSCLACAAGSFPSALWLARQAQLGPPKHLMAPSPARLLQDLAAAGATALRCKSLGGVNFAGGG